MPKLNPSVSGLSIFLSLALGLWELYFFFLGGRWEGPLGWFTPDRLGFNIAWLAVVYISFQLLSIPFALRSAKDRFIGVVDGLSSIVPARDCSHCDRREARASADSSAMGGSVLAAVHFCCRFVWRIHVQHRSEPKDDGRQCLSHNKSHRRGAPRRWPSVKTRASQRQPPLLSRRQKNN